MSVRQCLSVAQGGDLLDWTSRDGGIQEESFIQRIEALSTMGYSVLLSNYSRYFSLASYLSTFSQQSIVISMGIPSVRVRAHSSLKGDHVYMRRLVTTYECAVFGRRKLWSDLGSKAQ